jgi:hypothetical protein
MRHNILGLPETIEVDGHTYNVYYRYNRFSANVSPGDTVEAPTFEGLDVKIREYVARREAAAEVARQERAAKKGQPRKAAAPVVWALYGTNNERVKVRGVSGKSESWDRKLLITRADGRKDTVPERMLSSTSSDVDTLAKLNAERKAISDKRSALKKANGLGDIFSTLNQGNTRNGGTIEILYADGVFSTIHAGFEATGATPDQVEYSIVRQAVAVQRPWNVNYEDGEYHISPTSEYEGRIASYDDDFFASREDAEQYINLSKQESALVKQIKEASADFSYDAELAKVTAALAVVNGEA